MLIIICFLNREKVTVENITEFTSNHFYFAIPIILLLFAFKSVVMLIYSGILYASCGIIFPIYIAIVVSIVGTVIMVSVSYFLGKKSGKGILEKATKKYEKFSFLKGWENKNEIIITLIVRLIGLIPSDLVGMYFGAKNVCFKKYLLGSTLGFLPSALSFVFMGMGIKDITSPAFIISTSVQLSLIVGSILSCIFISKHKSKQNLKPQS